MDGIPPTLYQEAVQAAKVARYFDVVDGPLDETNPDYLFTVRAFGYDPTQDIHLLEQIERDPFASINLIPNRYRTDLFVEKSAVPVVPEPRPELESKPEPKPEPEEVSTNNGHLDLEVDLALPVG